MDDLSSLPTPPFDSSAAGAYASFITRLYEAALQAYPVNLPHGCLPLVFSPALYRQVAGLPPHVPLAQDDIDPLDPLLRDLPSHPGLKPVNTFTAASNAMCLQYAADLKEHTSLNLAISHIKAFTLKTCDKSAIIALSKKTSGMAHVTLPEIVSYMSNTFDKVGPMDIPQNNMLLSTKYTGDNATPLSSHVAELRRGFKEAERIDDAKSKTAQLSYLCDTVTGAKHGRFDPIIRDYMNDHSNLFKSFDELAIKLIDADKWHADKTQVAFGSALAATFPPPPPEANAALSSAPTTSYQQLSVNMSRLGIEEREIFRKLVLKSGDRNTAASFGTDNAPLSRATPAKKTFKEMACITKGPGCLVRFTPWNAGIEKSGKCKTCYDTTKVK
jgi:hypothetical protein